MSKKATGSGVPNIQVTVQAPPSAPDPSKKYWWVPSVVVPITVAIIGVTGAYFASRRSSDTSDTAKVPSGLIIVILQNKYPLMGDLKTQAIDASRLVDRGQFENARQAYAAIARNAAADPKMQLDADVSACALAIDAKYNGCGTQYWERLIEQNPDHVVANVDLALIYQRFNCERVGGTVQQCRNFIQQAFKMAAEHGLKP